MDDSSPQLDTETVTADVRVTLGRPPATVKGWQVEPLRRLGFGAAIHRVRGVASHGGARWPWSVIRKHVHDTGDGPADRAGAVAMSYEYGRVPPVSSSGG